MTVIDDKTVYCGICGGPIFEESQETEHQWLNSAVLLHASKDQEGIFELLEIPAKTEGGPFFTLENDERLTVYEVPTFENKLQPVLFVPCHIACVKIANIATSPRNGETSSTRSMQQVWASLEASWKAIYTRRFQIQPLTNLGQDGRYGRLDYMQDLMWLSDTDEFQYAELIEADPMRILHLTKNLLSYLEPMEVVENMSTNKEAPSTNDDPFTSIMHQLDWLREPQLDCTFSNSPSDWLHGLLEHNLLPWFWDLDQTALREKEASKGDKEWNWELWVRQLCQPNISELGQVIENLPLGLRNRRRIWGLLDDMLAT